MFENKQKILTAEFVSSFDYYSLYETSFGVMPDEKTVWGNSILNRNCLFKENLQNREFAFSRSTIDSQILKINTIQIIQNLGILVAAGESSIVQCDLPTGKIIKKYDLKLTNITSSAVHKHVLAAGDAYGCFSILDLIKREIIVESIKSASSQINTLRFCVVDKPLDFKGSRIFLSVWGVHNLDSKGKSSVFDFTDFFKLLHSSYSKTTEANQSPKRTVSLGQPPNFPKLKKLKTIHKTNNSNYRQPLEDQNHRLPSQNQVLLQVSKQWIELGKHPLKSDQFSELPDLEASNESLSLRNTIQSVGNDTQQVLHTFNSQLEVSESS